MTDKNAQPQTDENADKDHGAEVKPAEVHTEIEEPPEPVECIVERGRQMGF